MAAQPTQWHIEKTSFPKVKSSPEQQAREREKAANAAKERALLTDIKALLDESKYTEQFNPTLQKYRKTLVWIDALSKGGQELKDIGLESVVPHRMSYLLFYSPELSSSLVVTPEASPQQLWKAVQDNKQVEPKHADSVEQAKRWIRSLEQFKARVNAYINPPSAISRLLSKLSFADKADDIVFACFVV